MGVQTFVSVLSITVTNVHIYWVLGQMTYAQKYEGYCILE